MTVLCMIKLKKFGILGLVLGEGVRQEGKAVKFIASLCTIYCIRSTVCWWIKMNTNNVATIPDFKTWDRRCRRHRLILNLGAMSREWPCELPKCSIFSVLQQFHCDWHWFIKGYLTWLEKASSAKRVLYRRIRQGSLGTAPPLLTLVKISLFFHVTRRLSIPG